MLTMLVTTSRNNMTCVRQKKQFAKPLPKRQEFLTGISCVPSSPVPHPRPPFSGHPFTGPGAGDEAGFFVVRRHLPNLPPRSLPHSPTPPAAEANDAKRLPEKSKPLLTIQHLTGSMSSQVSKTCLQTFNRIARFAVQPECMRSRTHSGSDINNGSQHLVLGHLPSRIQPPAPGVVQ